jgi:hypothetical protein
VFREGILPLPPPRFRLRIPWLVVCPADAAECLDSCTSHHFGDSSCYLVENSPQHHPLAKVGKDVGAAAVLIAALTSMLVGLLVLGPPLWERLKLLFAGS